MTYISNSELDYKEINRKNAKDSRISFVLFYLMRSLSECGNFVVRPKIDRPTNLSKVTNDGLDNQNSDENEYRSSDDEGYIPILLLVVLVLVVSE